MCSSDLMRAAGTDVTESVLGAREGGVDVVIRDGVAMLPSLVSFAGSICTMDRALRVAHLRYGIPLTDVSRMLSLTPARLCGADRRKGSLAVGKDADILLWTKLPTVSTDAELKGVYIDGVRQL